MLYSPIKGTEYLILTPCPQSRDCILVFQKYRLSVSVKAWILCRLLVSVKDGQIKYQLSDIDFDQILISSQ